ncbi:putative G-protein coupled receptor ZC84.4 [Toxocara canis]|uniref:Putative G-protein coupled receptor ZC84.4 n=1 Tax=Toxocara canis TaxID=6265 RepID=A0A0B2UUT2_TOXCA|nr:putative G-protein coupled receptor ZC84.4 [Toxocara canis]
MALLIADSAEDFESYEQLEYQVPFQGYRRYVAFAYIGVNAIGFTVNVWVLYMVAPLLCSSQAKVPRSILFYIMTLCVSDLMIMIGLFSYFASMLLVMVMLWPVFAYSKLSSLYFHVNTTARTVNVLRKCSFMPPSGIELGFGVISCIASYAIPLGGMIYWYVSVPFFLKKRAEKSLVTSSSNDAAMRKVIATVLVLTVVYVSCWSPYWLSIFAHKFIRGMSRTVVIASYFIHLLPYVSCSAYPVIFTLMNRGIKKAHAQFVLHNKRRVKSLTDEAVYHIRAVRSRISSISTSGKRSTSYDGIDERRNENFDEAIGKKMSANLSPSCRSSASRSVMADRMPPSEIQLSGTSAWQTHRLDLLDGTITNEEDALL